MKKYSENISYNNFRTPHKSVVFKRNSTPKTASKVLPEVYHGSNFIHRTPGRHADISLLRKSSSRRLELSRVQSSVLYPETTPKIIKANKPAQSPEKIQRRVPMSKAEGEMILFREIFVKPKEEKLYQLKQLMENENFKASA